MAWNEPKNDNDKPDTALDSLPPYDSLTIGNYTGKYWSKWNSINRWAVARMQRRVKARVRKGELDMVQLPASRHFTLHELSEGIYAAIHAPGGLAQSNAGIIDIGDRTLVIDTFLSPRATQDLLAAAMTLTGRPAHIQGSSFCVLQPSLSWD